MLKGISIADYRSIGAEQVIAPLGKINVFVGPNNAGKSNVLRFVHQNLVGLMELCRGDGGDRSLVSVPHLSLGLPSRGRLALGASREQVYKCFGRDINTGLSWIDAIREKVSSDDVMWLDAQWPESNVIDDAESWLATHHWRELWQLGSRTTGGDLKHTWIPETLRRLRRLVPATPAIYAIPIDRRADNDEANDDANDRVKVIGGKGVIRSLAAMQNPDPTNFERDRERFGKVEDFVRTVTDDASAKISVPYRQDAILVQLKGQRYLPLASLGSGIEQVVLHAVAATSATDAVVTFEEPELHLHPVLQRQLVTYLAGTSNQYFISTHSAHIVDALHTNTFQVRLVDGQTVIENAATDAHRHRICTDLGYRASDIVQANCIIWVEGPSDRIYLRHWLKQVDEHLCENIHYSIMFYGGKLLSHLSARETDPIDTAMDDLIHLRLLNRHVAVIIDSDRKAANEPIRETKQRVATELTDHGGLVWITAGREIENYVPPATLISAVELVRPGRGAAVKKGQYDKALPPIKSRSKQTVDKIATAQKVADAGCGLELYDLKECVQKLAVFIRKANGLRLLSE